ncbi:MAG: hypothetical protein ABIB71_02335 [Candidatus Woesearchaeota archaeon]
MAIEEKLSKDINWIYAAKQIEPYIKVIDNKGPTLPRMKFTAQFILTEILMKGVEAALEGIEGIHTAYLYFTSKEDGKVKRESLKAMKEEMKREKENQEQLFENDKKAEKEFDQELVDAGLTLPQGKHAWVVAQCAGLALMTLFYHTESYKNDTFPSLEITKQKRCGNGKMMTEELKMDQATFEDIIDMSIRNGIEVLEDHYYGIPLYKEMPGQFNNVNPDFKEKAKERLLEEIYSGLDAGAEVNLLEHMTLNRDEKGILYAREIPGKPLW